MSRCPCGPGWRIESASLATGVVQAALPIVNFNCQNLLNDVGTGTFTMHPGDITNVRYIWPHLTSIWVTYYDEFVWGGILEQTSMQDGTLTLGCNSIEGYLKHRLIRDTIGLASAETTQLAAFLVNYAQQNGGIPLFGEWNAVSDFIDRSYSWWDRLNLYDQVSALTQSIPGVEWRLTADRSTDAIWTATMTFADHWGADRNDVVLVSNVQAPEYSLQIDTQNHATVVDAIGSGDEALKKIGSAYDNGPYAQFDTALQFNDMDSYVQLQQQADGYLMLNREPSVTPRMVLTGRENIQGLNLQLGDVVEARMCINRLRYDAKSRIIGDTWSAAPDTAATRELMLTPAERATDAMLDQPPCEPCVNC